MVKFVNEPEIDLGEMGVWRISSLEEIVKKCPNIIEERFKKRLEDYDARIKFLKSYKIGLWMCNLGDIERMLRDLDYNEKRREKLSCDLTRYYTTFPNRVPKC